ncbi:rCG32056 [Rattus norvegicus]|uniref:RCG32025 n=1 Tax=Rattus norvegicus TaxID=10116 RepID=A6KUA6_RAT|nr:rCG32025 [Rattus norvegicus]EDL84741.1 rCG32056 [Rattus norvegicus]
MRQVRTYIIFSGTSSFKVEI